MKRLRVFIPVLFYILFAAFAVRAESVYPPATVKMDLIKVSEHVYYVQGIPGVATDNQGFNPMRVS
ncbi:MAG TPA: hypothetical protein ENI74_10490 [Gammaproteobacteria bacterium]|nr:hypothetical protein [Gammaproteobacteria bacterium]